MNNSQYIDTNNYEFNTDSSDGIYIIHGFTNSTYEVKDLALYLSKQGFYTKIENLPGHGTSPEDCNRYKYTDWIEFVEQGVAEMASKCENLFVIGISMGSILAMHLSSLFPLKAAVFASIAIIFQDEFGVRILTPIFHRLIPFREKGYSYPKHIRVNIKFLGYEVWPMTAVNEMRKLTNVVKPTLHSIKCPSLLIHSDKDKLSLKENINYVYENISSEQKDKLVVHEANHNLFMPSSDQKIIFDKVVRKPKPGMETSYGNAGLIAPGHSYAWTTPNLPKNLIKSLYEKQRAFRFRFNFDPNMWRWGFQFIQQCTKSKMKENTLRKHRLSTYSQIKLHELINETGIRFYQNKKGLIYIFRSDKSFEEGKAKLALLKPNMNNLSLLYKSDLLNLEPALKRMNGEIAGGIYCASDESGSCYDFTIKLHDICKKMGVDFQFSTDVKKIIVKRDKIKMVLSTNNHFQADAYVLSFAAYSSAIAKMAGDYLPIYPVKGYSFTVPILDLNKTPIHGGIDEDNMLAFSLMGNKIRFTSVAEISGYDTTYKKDDFKKMIEFANSLFPEAFDYTKIEYWAGLRPMTPNGAPIFGKGKLQNLFYNTGHGHLGWTMCTGSSKIITDLIENNMPEINLEGMTLNTI